MDSKWVLEWTLALINPCPRIPFTETVMTELIAIFKNEFEENAEYFEIPNTSWRWVDNELICTNIVHLSVAMQAYKMTALTLREALRGDLPLDNEVQMKVEDIMEFMPQEEP